MIDTTLDRAGAEALVDSWRPHFADEYRRDSCNQRRQTFDEYWRWVKTYLIAGGSGFNGWMDQVEELAARVEDAAARARLREMLHRLGRTIAAEWSKDSACRKMYSTPWQGRPNLMDLGRRLQRAMASDRGDGATIELAVAELEAELLVAFRR
ncbi:MAG: hypothetical protein IPO81_31595 [Kouleothrix sp.]|nr:hypothetical protein [Kouleothrix sp.]